MTPEPLCGEHKRVCDPEHKRVCDPFSLATTSVARASAVGLEKLETLEKQARNEKKRGSFAQKSGLFLEIQKKRRIFAAIKDVRGSNEAPHFCL